MKRLGLLLVLIAGMMLALAPAALAQSEDRATVTGGKTLLKLNPDTAAALTDAGVGVSAVGNATGSAGAGLFAFPITGGKVSTDPVGGDIAHSGGLAFSAGGERLVVRRFVIDLDEGVLFATVAGTTVPLLNLEGGKADLKGPVIRLTKVRATLTPEAAGALNATFGTDLFTAGLPIGKTTTIATVR